MCATEIQHQSVAPEIPFAPFFVDSKEQMENISRIAGTDSAIRGSTINCGRSPYGPDRSKTEVRSMALLLLALMAGFVLTTGIVLADSGLRMWSAFGALGIQKAMLTGTTKNPEVPMLRTRAEARVVTRVSYARPAPAPLRAAA